METYGLLSLSYTTEALGEEQTTVVCASLVVVAGLDIVRLSVEDEDMTIRICFTVLLGFV